MFAIKVVPGVSPAMPDSAKILLGGRDVRTTFFKQASNATIVNAAGVPRYLNASVALISGICSRMPAVVVRFWDFLVQKGTIRPYHIFSEHVQKSLDTG